MVSQHNEEAYLGTYIIGTINNLLEVLLEAGKVKYLVLRKEGIAFIDLKVVILQLVYSHSNFFFLGLVEYFEIDVADEVVAYFEILLFSQRIDIRWFTLDKFTYQFTKKAVKFLKFLYFFAYEVWKRAFLVCLLRAYLTLLFFNLLYYLI